jgi:N-acetyl-gamma-glutamyl-phosphate reductase
MIKAKVIGAGGYGGIGIVELLTQHPDTEILCLVAKDSVGKPIGELYPHLAGTIDLPILPPDAPDVQVDADVVFMATPDRVGMELAAAELERGAKVIDYSGDFRFGTEADYAEYATRIGLDTVHASPELLPRSSYGLPELHRDAINPECDIVGNPGSTLERFPVTAKPGFQAPARSQMRHFTTLPGTKT